MNKLLVCSLALLVSASASMSMTLACINDYVTNHKAIAASRNIAADLTKVELIEPWTSRRDRLRKEVEADGDYKVRNDLASALMHTGDSQSAIQILEEIEKKNPGLYQTASNLGTAYELAGEPAKALEWIREGIKRNPKSHDASEWIHVMILEQKVSCSTLSADGQAVSILRINFGNEAKPARPTTLPAGNSEESLSLDQIEAGLKYQLHERLQFVKPPDAIVGSLLFDLGNIIALKPKGIGMAQGTYELAAKYAPSSLIHKREFRAQMANQKHSFFYDPFKVIAVIAFGIPISYYIVCKIRERRLKRVAAQQ